MSAPTAASPLATEQPNGFVRLVSSLSRRNDAAVPLERTATIDERNHCLQDMRENSTHVREQVMQEVDAGCANGLALYRSKTHDERAVKKEHRGLDSSRTNEVASAIGQIRQAGGHPNISQCLDLEVQQLPGIGPKLTTLDQFYPGGDLHSLKMRHDKGGLSIAESTLWHIARQLLLALVFLHTGPSSCFSSASPSDAVAWQPILHCDIKPENVLLQLTPLNRHAPTVLLADFDTAIHGPSPTVRKLSDRAAGKQPAVTVPPRAGASIVDAASALEKVRNVSGGTAHYAPPEFPRASTRGDVWGVGATLYYLACGRQPRRPVPQARVELAQSVASAEQTPKLGAALAVPAAGAVRDTVVFKASLNERLPLNYDVARLERKHYGLDYTSGDYSGEFARFVGRLLERDVEARLEASEALAELESVRGADGTAPKVPRWHRKVYDAEWKSSLELREERGRAKKEKKEAKKEAKRAEERAEIEESREAVEVKVSPRKRRESVAVAPGVATVKEEGEEVEDAGETAGVASAEPVLGHQPKKPSKSDSGVDFANGGPRGGSGSGESASAAQARAELQRVETVVEEQAVEENASAPERKPRSKAMRLLRAAAYVATPAVLESNWLICAEQNTLGLKEKVKMVYRQE